MHASSPKFTDQLGWRKIVGKIITALPAMGEVSLIKTMLYAPTGISVSAITLTHLYSVL